MSTIEIDASGNDEQDDIVAFLSFQLGLELAELASPGNHPRVRQLLADVAAGERHVPRPHPSVARIGPDKMRDATREIAKRILAFEQRLLGGDHPEASL